jgi:glycosyltransferase involved in cell wall biosynthesis
MIDIHPETSIITVVYNEKIDLEETTKSVLSKIYFNLEYIINDGGLIDKIKKFQEK